MYMKTIKNRFAGVVLMLAATWAVSVAQVRQSGQLARRICENVGMVWFFNRPFLACIHFNEPAK
jgi:hypothetical protein